MAHLRATSGLTTSSLVARENVGCRGLGCVDWNVRATNDGGLDLSTSSGATDASAHVIDHANVDDASCKLTTKKPELHYIAKIYVTKQRY